MGLFSEVYSCYYNAVNRILNECVKKTLTKSDIADIIEQSAFQESTLYIMPKLLSGEWNLLKKEESNFSSKLSSGIKLPMTGLEKAWLKSLLMDKRMKLFLDQGHISELNEKLKYVTPLYNNEDFYYYDIFTDGDDYDDENYVKKFRVILQALKNKNLVTLSTDSAKGRRVTGIFMPIKLEYSSKDDKFRVYAARIRGKKIISYVLLNIGRIARAEPCLESYIGEASLDAYLESSKCLEPVVIEISKERNAVERCMLHFASYEKRTEYDESTDKYISYIYYDKKDETELLIRVLSFGPVIRVLGPEPFLDLVKERVKKQMQLML